MEKGDGKFPGAGEVITLFVVWGLSVFLLYSCAAWLMENGSRLFGGP